MTLLQIYHWLCNWRNFENRSKFGEVIDESINEWNRHWMNSPSACLLSAEPVTSCQPQSITGWIVFQITVGHCVDIGVYVSFDFAVLIWWIKLYLSCFVVTLVNTQFLEFVTSSSRWKTSVPRNCITNFITFLSVLDLCKTWCICRCICLVCLWVLILKVCS